MTQQMLPVDNVEGVTKATAAYFNTNFGKINSNFTEVYGAISSGGTGSALDWRVVPPTATADDINAAILAQWSAGGGTVYLSGHTYSLNKTVHFRPRFTHSGTAQAGSTSTTIKLATSAATNNFDYINALVKITAGTGSGQVRVISSYVNGTKVATVSTAWTTTPDATSVYTVQYHSSAQWMVDVVGNSVTGTKLVAASGFVDDSFDGKEFVARLEGGINERAGRVTDMTIDGAGQADYGLYNMGTVERTFERLNLQGAVIAPYVMDASQNCYHVNVRCMGGQYAHIVLNGAASYKFERCEFTNATTDTTLYKSDSTFRGYGWYPGVVYPLMGKYDTCLMEIPQAGSSSMVPLRILAGVGIEFVNITFATSYSSGTKSAGCVVLGSGSSTDPIEDIRFKDCQFYRGGDTSSGDYILINSEVLGTVVEDGRFTGGYSGGNVAIRASGPVLVRGYTFRDSAKSFVDQTGAGNIVHVQPPRTSWTTANRPSFGSGIVILPGFNTTTGKLEFNPGSGWQNVASAASGAVVGESPTGTKNGVNTVFTLASAYVSGSTAVYLNGLRETNYTETSSTQITFSTAPQSGDTIAVDYST